MPPKARIHKPSGKPKPKNSQPISGNETASSGVNLDTEAARQFELELCWCIQQLHNSLKGDKLSPKQVQDTTKALNTLMSNSAPLVKKRQVMSLTFGDYRAKMAAEDRKFQSVTTRIKVIPVIPNKNSAFFKKAGRNFHSISSTPGKDIADELSKVQISNPVPNEAGDQLGNFKFEPSDNKFQFNFNFCNSV